MTKRSTTSDTAGFTLAELILATTMISIVLAPLSTPMHPPPPPL